MTSRYMTTGAGFFALLLAGVLAACGGETERPGEPDRGAAEAPAAGDTGAVAPGALDGMEGGATDATGADGDADAGTGTPQAGGPGAATDAPASPGTGAGAGPDAGAGTGQTGPGAPSPAPSQPQPAAPAAGQQAESTDAILRATARTYERVRSIQADFEQSLTNPLLGRTTESRGTLYQRQPDRFLMQFSDPDGDVIVSDGQHFWIYYPSVDERQVIRAPRGPQGMDMHAQFIGDPVSRFQATSHGREAVRGRQAHVMTLVPRENLGYRSLKVWIDTQDHLVRRFELTEETGNVRRFELSNVSLNPSLPDRLFQFTPPPGAQVIQR